MLSSSFQMVDVPFPLDSQTVFMPQLQQISTNYIVLAPLHILTHLLSSAFDSQLWIQQQEPPFNNCNPSTLTDYSLYSPCRDREHCFRSSSVVARVLWQVPSKSHRSQSFLSNGWCKLLALCSLPGTRCICHSMIKYTSFSFIVMFVIS
jgi:hypothetical protein